MRSVGDVTQFVLNKSRRNRWKFSVFVKERIMEIDGFYNTILLYRFLLKVYPPSVWRAVFGKIMRVQE